MRIRILKSIASIYGGFAPGMVVDVPEPVGKSWCNAGIAKEASGQDKTAEARLIIPQKKSAKTPTDKPEVVPEGMFWCSHCQVLHRANSNIGKRHLKYSG